MKVHYFGACIIIGLILLTACAPAASPTSEGATTLPEGSPTPTPTVEEETYAVLNTILGLHSDAVLDMTDPHEATELPSDSTILSELPGTTQELVDNFAKTAYTHSMQLDPNRLTAPITLISEAEYDELQEASPDPESGDDYDPFFEVLAERYPDTGGVLGWISNVGFNDAYDSALVVYGSVDAPLEGNGSLYFLQKIEGVWQIQGSLLIWEA